MNKSELARDLSEISEVRPVDLLEKVIDAVTDVVKQRAAAGLATRFSVAGYFRPKVMIERRYVVPATASNAPELREYVIVPARVGLRFEASEHMAETVRMMFP